MFVSILKLEERAIPPAAESCASKVVHFESQLVDTVCDGVERRVVWVSPNREPLFLPPLDIAAVVGVVADNSDEVVADVSSDAFCVLFSEVAFTARAVEQSAVDDEVVLALGVERLLHFGLLHFQCKRGLGCENLTVIMIAQI